MSTDTTWQTLSQSAEDTEHIAAKLARQLRGGETIELKSDLGGGKTTFTKGLVAALGSTDHVSSPTFMISKEYTSPQFRIVHFDFYRLQTAGDVSEALREAALDESTICVVEWGDIVDDVLPANRTIISFERDATNESARAITISSPHSYLFKELQS